MTKPLLVKRCHTCKTEKPAAEFPKSRSLRCTDCVANPPVCSVDGCCRPVNSGELCFNHARRKMRTGSPLVTPRNPMFRIVPKIRRTLNVGDRRGHVILIGVPFYAKPHGQPWSIQMAVCQCDCDNIVARDLGEIVKLKEDMGPKGECRCADEWHGKSGTRLHSIWLSMRSRCINPNSVEWHLYGGRGITVCDEWESFTKFETWAMQSGYDDSLTIDRIDANVGYSPNNCRFATAEQQVWNRRKLASNSPYIGVCQVANKWRASIKHHKKSVYLGMFHTPEDAARAYDNAARRFRGEFAVVNFA